MIFEQQSLYKYTKKLYNSISNQDIRYLHNTFRLISNKKIKLYKLNTKTINILVYFNLFTTNNTEIK